MIRTRYRQLGLAAVAVFFGLVISAGPAYGAPPEGDPGRSADAPGQEKKAEDPAPATDPADTGGGTGGGDASTAPAETADTASTETVEEAAEGGSLGASGSTTASGSGFTGGGQVCDGDPSGRSSSGNGANTNGPDNDYAHNCGADSDNGNGGGKATGRPCAGCVGNADDKNPPGQFRNGNDKNHGYECDAKGKPNGGNNGVGKGNPAHTPCKPTTTQTCPDGTPLPANGQCGTTTQSCPDGTPVPANGQCGSTTPACVGVCTTSTPPGTPPAEVLGVSFSRPTEVLGVQVTRGAGLAFTGAATMPLMATAVALLAMGAALIVASRRQEEELVHCAARLAGHVWSGGL